MSEPSAEAALEASVALGLPVGSSGDPTRLWVVLFSLAALVWLFGTIVTGGAFPFLLALCLCVFAAASLADAASFAVPNRITYPAVVFGLVIGVLADPAWAPPRLHLALGSAGAMQHLTGLAVWLGACLPAWLLGWIGGGDLKLLCALGTLIGLNASFTVTVWALPCAMIYALLNVLTAGGLNLRLNRLAAAFSTSIGWAIARPIDPAAARSKVPLAVPLVFGVVLALALPTTWLDWAWRA